MRKKLDGGARILLTRLQARGYGAYIVGGAVRDMLRGATPHDYDIATSAVPAQIRAVFTDLRTYDTGAAHGTVGVIYDGKTYEITTFRRDGAYSDGRRPDAVEFTGDLCEDLARRDFTVNAMAMDADGRVCDPFSGKADLSARRIRCVGDPDRRFAEDGLRLLRARRTTVKGKTCAAVDMTPFFSALPFSLTGAQARAVDDILRDMTAERPMNRLVQGDVGSGKTMVAAAGIYFAAKNGLQAALMAPTEILAEQHYHTLAPLLEKLGVRCALLTASTKAKTRRSILEQLAAGEIDLAIGTHALLSPDISYQSLGLVVTDEQHRFGVNQRAALGAKGENPHLLVMSATPIPRTLALMIYGDLDVSVIDELPPGRRSIETYAVPSSYHERIYAFLEKQLAEGRQAYIVCPMVEENGELPDERKAVTAYAEKLQKEVFPNRTVRFLHGKMKPKEKEMVMRAFAAGEIDVLVSTTVVEVGVDVPNASVMLIENAECFGLSQLHQLRGRVGRGPWQSYCILVSDNRGEDNKTRLDAMRRTQSGFALAEEDLKLRGPGDFFGARQHGLPTLRVADFACDMELLYEAQGAAEALLALDPRLEGHPALHARVRELFDLNAEALN